MKRSHRQTLARETVEIVAAGSYTAPSGRRVDIGAACRAARDGTRVYSSLQLTDCGAVLAGQLPALLEVSFESTFAALARLSSEGENHIGCLNFASAKNPGGGFLNGAEAQEEALARASALYDCLLCGSEYYERNRTCSTCLYEDFLIGSPKVPFFRDDDGLLLEVPLLASVITAPAPNAGAVRRNEPDRIQEIEPILCARAEMVLHLSVLMGVECLILGAWGCGVFRNDPGMVARSFAACLKPGGEYAARFRRVVFAVYDPAGTSANMKAFQVEFDPSAQSNHTARNA